jgi:hypothetical protein
VGLAGLIAEDDMTLHLARCSRWTGAVAAIALASTTTATPRTSRTSSHEGARTARRPTPSAPAPLVGAAACNPVVQWEWIGDVRSPTHPQPCVTPLVVQLTDDDGDGVVGCLDIPDVVFTHASPPVSDVALVTAVSGDDGRELWTAAGVLVQPAALAAGDVDGDGLIEVLAVGADFRTLVALSSTGALEWTRPFAGSVSAGDTVGIADMNQDGVPEVYSSNAVSSTSGMLSWNGTGTRGGVRPDSTTSHAADLDPASPGLELLAGPTLYSASGATLWRATGLPDGFTGIGDVDGDGDPEIVLAGADRGVYLLDHSGTRLGPSYEFPDWTLTYLSGPLVADLDGDGRAEVFVSHQSGGVALEWDGVGLAVAWTQSATRHLCCTAPVAFDLDGDGAQEIVFRDDNSWFVIDGRSGAVLSSTRFPSKTRNEAPVVANIDADNLTEIVVSGCSLSSLGVQNAVVAYECCPSPQPARATWNQAAYHVTNVEDDGSIPVVEAPPWQAGLPWSGQSPPRDCPARPATACTPPPAPGCATWDDLVATIEGADIDREGVRRSLRQKARSACAAWGRAQPDTSGNVLCALVHECDAQEGRHVAPGSATAIRDCAWSLADILALPMSPCER